jgi:uncharacterized RDD family membrane protein YckC
MHTPPAPPGWYPDPVVPGAQRYFDGAVWTGHVVGPSQPGVYQPPGAAPPGTGPWGVAPTWKGAKYGRPAAGAGSLATPWRRLGARTLDNLVLLPAILAIEIPTIIYASHRLHHFFLQLTLARHSNDPHITFGSFFAAYPVFLGAGAALLVVSVAYEAIMTVTRGRTLGKQAVGIRPVRIDGRPMGWGRAILRPLIYFGANLLLSVAGVLDVLWCLWDPDRQCLHDKVVETLVVNDR